MMRSMRTARSVAAPRSNARSFHTSNAARKDVSIYINGKPHTVKQGSTILDACEAAGVSVPTICYHPSQKPPAVCRVCLVQVGDPKFATKPPGRESKLVPSCATPVQEGASYWTNTQYVREGIRGSLKLLLTRHPVECPTCEASGECQFQDLLYRYNVKDTPASKRQKEVIMSHRHHVYDDSSPSIIRDMDKCILCTKCIQQCQLQAVNCYGMAQRGNEEYVTTIGDKPVYDTECISCGQCSYVCPTGAISARSNLSDTLDMLESGNKVAIVQVAPAVRVAIGEEFGMEPGGVNMNQLAAGLRKLGFDYVFDTNFTADLTILEEGTELLSRIKSGGPFPMFTSCCPAWINWIEKKHPELRKNLSTCRSPQGMMGSLIKTYFAKKIGKNREDICVVSIMPCTAKKDECTREQLKVNGNPDVDIALTTRELGRLFKLRHIHLPSLPESAPDNPLGLSSGAAVIFGVTGGVMEAALRTAYEVALNKPLPKIDFEEVRGLDGIRSAEIDFGGKPLKVAIAHGMTNVKKLTDALSNKEAYFDFVEMMACPGGCIGGGGEPKTLEKGILQKRMKSIYRLDELSTIRKSHENPAILEIYKEFLEKPNSHLAHELLHTYYKNRSGIPLPEDEHEHHHH